jgi:hypothetical protein
VVYTKRQGEVVDTEQQREVVDTEQQREVVDTEQQREVVDTEQQREVVDTEQQREVVDTAQQGEVLDPEEQRHVIFTARQRELLRTRVDAYRDVQNERRGLSWPALCDEIFDLVHVHVRHEFLRQWVEGFIEKKKKQPRRPNNEEFAGIASFLMHPEIGMLSEEELNEPEIPYRFAAFLLDFLAHPGHKQQFPPLALSGTYVAFGKAEDGRIRPKAWLGLEVREGDHVIRIWEISQTWSFLVDARVDDDEPFSEKVLKAQYRANGWGVITPEDNLFIFLKDERSGKNHYYFTLASYPSLWSDTALLQFGLIRHEYPVPDDSSAKYLDELFDDTEDETVFLRFDKIT